MSWRDTIPILTTGLTLKQTASYFRKLSVYWRYYREHVSTLLFSRSVMSDSLWSHGLQHTRLPCPSPSPGACSNSCPLSQWYQPTISFSVVPFSSCLQSFPAPGSFPMSWLFESGGQSIRVSALASVLPMNIQGWIFNVSTYIYTHIENITTGQEAKWTDCFGIGQDGA